MERGEASLVEVADVGGAIGWRRWGNIGQYGLGRILKTKAEAVGVGIVRDVVFSFCLFSDRS